MKQPQQNNCLILCRVSTLKQAQQGESIDVQEKICLGIAERQNLPVYRVFREYFSGRKDKRPVIEDIFDCLKENPGRISALIIRGIDRMTRAGTITYEQLKQRLYRHGVMLVDTYGTIQPQTNTLAHLGVEYDWSRHSPSEITELILAHQSKKEVTDILTRTIGAEIELARNGYKVRGANDGYVNKVIFIDGKRKVIQVADAQRAGFYRQMFEFRAKTPYTDAEIVKRINAMGFTTRPRNRWSQDKSHVMGQYGCKPLTVKQYQMIIHNPIYCGVNTEKWLQEPIKTKYEGLVSIHIFNEANRGKVFIEELPGHKVIVHHNYSSLHIKRLKENPEYPYRFVLCPLCCKPLTGSASRGKSGQKFPAYHCFRNHRYFRIKQQEVHNTMTSFVRNLKYTEGFVPSLEETFLNKYREKEKELEQFAEKAVQNTVDLEIQKKQKIDAFAGTQNVVIRNELEKQIEELQEQIENSASQKKKMDIEEHDIHSFSEYAKDLMEHPEKLLNTSDINRLKALYTLVFDKMPTYEEIANGTPDLSLPYKLSAEFSKGKSGLGCLESLDWNEVETTIQKWNKTFNPGNRPA